MNRTIATALIAFSAAGAAFADDITIDDSRFTSTRSTADVQAELKQFKQAGVNPWSQGYNPLKDFRSTKTRAQVTAEYLNARDRVAAFTAEDSGSAYLAARTRDAGSATLAGQPANAQ